MHYRGTDKYSTMSYVFSYCMPSHSKDKAIMATHTFNGSLTYGNFLNNSIYYSFVQGESSGCSIMWYIQ